MSLRNLIEIDEEACDGCGACQTGCPEGALRVIDGKARLVGESLCDGLGACVGVCPRGAIKMSRREAQAYDERSVLAGILPQGREVLEAHLEHLEHHGQDLYLRQALARLAELGIEVPGDFGKAAAVPKFSKPCGLAGAPRFQELPAQAAAGTGRPARAAKAAAPAKPASALRNWPVQLHLVNPRAPQFQGAELVVAADCTAYALGSFHTDILGEGVLTIACPKLDHGLEVYLDKLGSLMAKAASLKVVTMEVPCCSGLLRLVDEARKASRPELALDHVVVGIDGAILSSKRL